MLLAQFEIYCVPTLLMLMGQHITSIPFGTCHIYFICIFTCCGKMIFSRFYKLVFMLFLHEKSHKSLLPPTPNWPSLLLLFCRKKQLSYLLVLQTSLRFRQSINDGLLHLEHVMVNRLVISEKIVLVVDARGNSRT